MPLKLILANHGKGFSGNGNDKRAYSTYIYIYMYTFPNFFVLLLFF